MRPRGPRGCSHGASWKRRSHRVSCPFAPWEAPESSSPFSLVLSPLGKRRSHLLPCPRGRPQTSSHLLPCARGRPQTSSHRVSCTFAPPEFIKKIIPSHFRLSRIYQKNNFPCKAPNRPAVAFFPWPLSPPSFPCEVASEGLFEPLSTISLERKVSRGYVGDWGQGFPARPMSLRRQTLPLSPGHRALRSLGACAP